MVGEETRLGLDDSRLGDAIEEGELLVIVELLEEAEEELERDKAGLDPECGSGSGDEFKGELRTGLVFLDEVWGDRGGFRLGFALLGLGLGFFLFLADVSFGLSLPGLVFGLGSLRLSSFGKTTTFLLPTVLRTPPFSKACLTSLGMGPSVRSSQVSGESTGNEGRDAFFFSAFFRALSLRFEAVTRSWLPRQRRESKNMVFIWCRRGSYNVC